MKTQLNPFYWLKRTYEWTLKWADHHRNQQALSLLAFTESIFFPIPPDVLLMLMGVAKPKRALYYGALCSFFSVLGGVAGYLIGLWAWHLVDDFFYRFVFSPELFQKVGVLFNENAFWAVFTAAFTPIPFKVFTVSAGAFEIAFLPFLLGSAVGRPLRFMTVAVLIYFFGAPVKVWVEKYFNILTLLFTALLIIGFVSIKYMF